MSSSVAAAPPRSQTASIPPGYSSEIVHVRFKEGSNVNPPEAALPPALLNSVASITRLFSLPEAALGQMRTRGQRLSHKTLPDLKLWFKITLKPGTDAGAFMESLKRLDNVEIVEPTPLPSPPPATTPNFTGNQGYLNAAPGGIDALFSWTIPQGNGSGVKIYDVEYSWNQTHEDLSKANGIPLLLTSGDSTVDPFNDNNHGTAVLGELVADHDTKGVTGISWGSTISLAPANTANLGYNPANAILLAVAIGSAGDVILIEQQVTVCGLSEGSYGPAEWVAPVFDAVQAATANGFVVVEAAGNGNVNLDQAACNNMFNRNTRDSGAIIVGAGGSAGSSLDRQRLSFSSYGSRVDLQGWGSNVMTTGYGSFYTNSDDPTNPNFWYTNTFNGTSSASPIVAGAATNLQSIARDQFGVPLTPFQTRILLSQTGSPQLGNTAENIGPRPDLRAAIGRLTTGALDVFIIVDLSGSFTDDLPNFQTQAPNIISTLRAANPNTRFGIGRFEDYPIDPFGNAAAGDKAYERLVDLTFDTGPVLNTISGLFTRDGADLPQSQLPALLQAATGTGQDLSGAGFPGASIPVGQQANFRAGATKIFLLWTDAAFHRPGDSGSIPYPGPSFSDVANAMQALDPGKVIGISAGTDGLADLQQIAAATNTIAPPEGVDCNGDGVIDVAGGAPLVCVIGTSGEGIGAAILASVEAVALPFKVNIDIKPGSSPTSPIRLSSPGRIPVAILSTPVFDAPTRVDKTSLTFGRTGYEKSLASCSTNAVDVNGDGLLDQVCNFKTQLTGFQINDTEGVLRGKTVDGFAIEGRDLVKIVP